MASQITSVYHSTKSKTIEWLRFFCAVLVCYLHAFGSRMMGGTIAPSQYGGFYTISVFLSQGLCRVAVPIFFFISGNLFFNGFNQWDKGFWLNKVKRRVKTLALPYLLWNLITILCLLFSNYIKYLFFDGNPVDIVSWFKQIGGISAFWSIKSSGFPINGQMWYIRDLMVFIILSPFFYFFLKKTKIIGLTLLYFVYLLDCRIRIPGLSIEGVFFFSLGAYNSLFNIDYTSLLSKRRWLFTALAIPFLAIMVISYDNNMATWSYCRCLFTLLGTLSIIGIVSFYFENNSLVVRPLLSNSSFFIYAAHMPIFLPSIQIVLWKVLPAGNLGFIVNYFVAPIITIVFLVICYSVLRKWMPRTMAILTGGR